MNCKSVQNRLSAYVDRELTGAEMLSVRAHLSICEMCRIEEDGLRRLKQVLAASPAPEPPADLADRLMASILADRKPEPARPKWRLNGLAFAGIAACSMAVTYVTLSVLQGQGGPSGPVSAGKGSRANVAFEVERDQAMMAGTDATGGVPIISASTYASH